MIKQEITDIFTKYGYTKVEIEVDEGLLIFEGPILTDDEFEKMFADLEEYSDRIAVMALQIEHDKLAFFVEILEDDETDK